MRIFWNICNVMGKKSPIMMRRGFCERRMSIRLSFRLRTLNRYQGAS